MFATKINITMRRATTAFDRHNYTILEVMHFSEEWEATNYSSKDFFAIFDAVFSVDIFQPGWNTSSKFDFLVTCWSYLTERIERDEEAGVIEGMSKLRSLFTVPVLEFNNAVFGDPYPDDLGKSISLATVTYRVRLISSKTYRQVIMKPYSFWIFVAGTILWTGWCLLVLTACMFVQAPDLSLFPEIDFTSRLIGGKDPAVTEMDVNGLPICGGARLEV